MKPGSKNFSKKKSARVGADGIFEKFSSKIPLEKENFLGYNEVDRKHRRKIINKNLSVSRRGFVKDIYITKNLSDRRGNLFGNDDISVSHISSIKKGVLKSIFSLAKSFEGVFFAFSPFLFILKHIFSRVFLG